MTRQWQVTGLMGILLASTLLLLFMPPLVQPPDYHAFADQRSLLGIPHWINVLSNIPFLLIGIGGIRFCLHQQQMARYRSWLLFFTAFAAVSLGSGYYHWAPDDAALVWDRIPITLAFMGLFSVILSDTLFPRTEHWLLPLLFVLGPASVTYWYFSGDLRPYIWIQFTPLLCIAFLLMVHDFTNAERSYWLAAFGAYVLAKLCESADAWIYTATRELLAGHSLKHLFAAGSGYLLYRMLRTESGRSRHS